MRPILIIAAVIAVLILGKIFFWNNDSKAADGAPGGDKSGAVKAIAVLTEVVKLDESDKAIYSSGTLIPNEEVEIRSEIAGRLIKLNIREGTVVPKGNLIAKLKDDDIRAQLKKLAMEDKLAQQIEARQKKLLEINAISKEEYEISANKVGTLSADKELLNVQLEKTELKAPFSGKIGLKNISEGAYISPTTVIATLVQTNPIKIDFTIPERYLNEVKLGQVVFFEVDGADDKFSSRIVAIDPKVDPNLRTLKVRAQASNNGGRLYPGMFVKINLKLNSSPAIMIPSETIIPILGGKKVYVKRNGVVEEVSIETGLRNEKYVQVLSGLNVGDSLITTSLMNLKNGQPVISK
ncbi:membrane fusion protein, multidrug efflux system [Spirosomataceae bacterium TFI 002]|nr:membrane fusion protein, multidrug efflux system [Spirosomataceae bacterium TFI 002]